MFASIDLIEGVDFGVDDRGDIGHVRLANVDDMLPSLGFGFIERGEGLESLLAYPINRREGCVGDEAGKVGFELTFGVANGLLVGVVCIFDSDAGFVADPVADRRDGTDIVGIGWLAEPCFVSLIEECELPVDRFEFER